MIHDDEGVPGPPGRTTRDRPQETSLQKTSLQKTASQKTASQKTECWCPSPSTTCRSACC